MTTPTALMIVKEIPRAIQKVPKSSQALMLLEKRSTSLVPYVPKETRVVPYKAPPSKVMVYRKPPSALVPYKPKNNALILHEIEIQRSNELLRQHREQLIRQQLIKHHLEQQQQQQLLLQRIQQGTQKSVQQALPKEIKALESEVQTTLERTLEDIIRTSKLLFQKEARRAMVDGLASAGRQTVQILKNIELVDLSDMLGWALKGDYNMVARRFFEQAKIEKAVQKDLSALADVVQKIWQVVKGPLDAVIQETVDRSLLVIRSTIEQSGTYAKLAESIGEHYGPKGLRRLEQAMDWAWALLGAALGTLILAWLKEKAEKLRASPELKDEPELLLKEDSSVEPPTTVDTTDPEVSEKQEALEELQEAIQEVEEREKRERETVRDQAQEATERLQQADEAIQKQQQASSDTTVVQELEEKRRLILDRMAEHKRILSDYKTLPMPELRGYTEWAKTQEEGSSSWSLLAFLGGFALAGLGMLLFGWLSK